MTFRLEGYDPDRWLQFVRFLAFTHDWERLGFDGDDLQILELAILEDPMRPPVVQGTGGLRKIRHARRKTSRGKSEQTDLEPADRLAVALAVELFRHELQAAFRRDEAGGGDGGGGA